MIVFYYPREGVATYLCERHAGEHLRAFPLQSRKGEYWQVCEEKRGKVCEACEFKAGRLSA